MRSSKLQYLIHNTFFEVVLWMYLSLSLPLSLTRHYPMESTRDLCIGAAELIPSIPKSIWSKSLWRLVRKTQGDRRHQQHGYGLHQVVHFGLHHMHRARPQPPSNFQTSICWFIVRLESEFFHLKPSTSQRHLDVFSNISANKYLNKLRAFSYVEKVGKDKLLMKIIVRNRIFMRILIRKSTVGIAGSSILLMIWGEAARSGYSAPGASGHAGH